MVPTFFKSLPDFEKLRDKLNPKLVFQQKIYQLENILLKFQKLINVPLTSETL